MPETDTHSPTKISIPADLNVAGAGDAHAKLVAALDGAEEAGTVEVDLTDGAATPLALQLVVSTARSLPSDRLTLGPRAAAALTSLETLEED